MALSNYQYRNNGNSFLWSTWSLFQRKTGKIISWTEDPVALDNYENTEELRNDLEKILSDIKKQPVLLESELEQDLETDNI